MGRLNATMEVDAGQEVYPPSPETSILSPFYEYHTSVEFFFFFFKEREPACYVWHFLYAAYNHSYNDLMSHPFQCSGMCLHHPHSTYGRTEAREAEAMSQVTEATWYKLGFELRRVGTRVQVVPTLAIILGSVDATLGTGSMAVSPAAHLPSTS